MGYEGGWAVVGWETLLAIRKNCVSFYRHAAFNYSVMLIAKYSPTHSNTQTLFRVQIVCELGPTCVARFVLSSLILSINDERNIDAGIRIVWNVDFYPHSFNPYAIIAK